MEGIDADTLRKINVILIPRNTALPAQATERFATKSAGQRSIVIQVLEGESSSPGDCTAIGRTVIRDLPDGLPKGWPVEVTFAYGANGRLSVRARSPARTAKWCSIWSGTWAYRGRAFHECRRRWVPPRALTSSTPWSTRS